MLTYTSLPKIVTTLLKLRHPTAQQCNRLSAFFQQLLQTSATMLVTSPTWEIVECAARILSDQPSYHIYNRPSTPNSAEYPEPHVDGPDLSSSADSSLSDDHSDDGVGGVHGAAGCGLSLLPSSTQLHTSSRGDVVKGAGQPGTEPAACWHMDRNILTSSSVLNDFSPYYLRNVEVFHHAGGFDALLNRIGQEPAVGLAGVKLLLRPFLRVREVISSRALSMYARAAHRSRAA